MPKAGVLAEPVLVGREKELEELQAFLDSAIQGKGKTVFISGEAGSGKTRLAREFLRAAVKQGIAVMAGWCLSDSQVPYFPFMEAFNNYYVAQAEEESVSASLLQPQAELGLGAPVRVGTARGEMEITAWLSGKKSLGRAEVLSPQAWKDQVFVEVSKILHTIAAQNPTVLFIEDVHWADSASLALLHYVARAINNSERILVLATYRSEELTADTEGRPHPLAETLRLMRREELGNEVKLSSLDQACVSKISESMIGGVLQQEFAGKLTAESRGNPLFVIESLRMLNERRSLIQENSEWRLTVDELGIPSKIKDIILRRLAVLKYVQRRILDAASVIGEEFSIELLSTVLQQDSLEVLETLNLVAHTTSIVYDTGNCYRFDHARSREILYDELSPSLKRGYHARIAEKLESAKSMMPPLGDLSFHYAQAGNKDKAVKYAMAAGKDELGRFSNEEAIKHFTYVLQTLGENPDPAQEENAMEGLADALFAGNRVKESMKMYEDLYEKPVTDVVKLRVLRKAMESAWVFGDSAHLMDLVKKAEPYASSDRLENARVLMYRGRVAHMQGVLLKTDECYRAALQVFEEEYSLWDTAYALIGTAFFRGLADCLRSVSLFDELGDFRWEMEAALAAETVFGVFGASALDQEGEQFPRRVIELEDKLKMGDYYRLTIAYVYLSWLPMCAGDFEKALSCVLRGLEASKKTGSLSAQTLVYGRLATLYSLLGDLKMAQGYLERAMEISPEGRSLFFAEISTAQMTFCVATGKMKESESYFSEALKVYPLPWAVKCIYAWALEKAGCFEKSQVLREQVQAAYREAQEKFAQVDVQGNLMARRQVSVGEQFEMRVDLVNVARSPGKLVKIDGIVTPDAFTVTSFSNWCKLEEGTLSLKEKPISPFKVETARLKLKVSKPGSYNLTPTVTYKDEFGNTKTSKTNQITINVQPEKPTYEVLPGRVPTGTLGLDRLLCGGIPEGYAIVLVSPAFEERQRLIRNYVEFGLESGHIAFYLTDEPGDTRGLAEKYPEGMYFFVCNPRADLVVKDLPNVYKLKGVDNLTDIDIALAKASRQLKTLQPSPRRACIEIVSDVLLQHHAVTTRKWLSGLIQDLKSRGFTIMAVINPQMHPSEDVQAILSLFDGEIHVAEKDGEKGKIKILRIERLYNQRYSEEELALIKEKQL